jgi:hypothetical protein
MTKMEACHYLTVLRDELVKDQERFQKRLKEEVSDAERVAIDPLPWIQARLLECSNQIKAIDMAGSALTR